MKKRNVMTISNDAIKTRAASDDTYAELCDWFECRAFPMFELPKEFAGMRRTSSIARAQASAVLDLNHFCTDAKQWRRVLQAFLDSLPLPKQDDDGKPTKAYITELSKHPAYLSQPGSELAEMWTKVLQRDLNIAKYHAAQEKQAKKNGLTCDLC